MGDRALAPPQQPVYQTPRAALVRRFLSILLAVIVTVGTIVFIAWLIIRPRLPAFRVDSLSLSNFNVSSAFRLTGKWDVLLTSLNPNSKFRLHYDAFEAGVFYRDEVLAETNLTPFVQGTKDLTALKASFVAKGAHVDRWVAERIRRERAESWLDFNVRLAANMSFKMGFWRARKRWVRIYCGGLEVGLTAAGRSGSLIGGREKGCSVW